MIKKIPLLPLLLLCLSMPPVAAHAYYPVSVEIVKGKGELLILMSGSQPSDKRIYYFNEKKLSEELMKKVREVSQEKNLKDAPRLENREDALLILDSFEIEVLLGLNSRQMKIDLDKVPALEKTRKSRLRDKQQAKAQASEESHLDLEETLEIEDKDTSNTTSVKHSKENKKISPKSDLCGKRAQTINSQIEEISNEVLKAKVWVKEPGQEEYSKKLNRTEVISEGDLKGISNHFWNNNARLFKKYRVPADQLGQGYYFSNSLEKHHYYRPEAMTALKQMMGQRDVKKSSEIEEAKANGFYEMEDLEKEYQIPETARSDFKKQVRSLFENDKDSVRILPKVKGKAYLYKLEKFKNEIQNLKKTIDDRANLKTQCSNDPSLITASLLLIRYKEKTGVKTSMQTIRTAIKANHIKAKHTLTDRAHGLQYFDAVELEEALEKELAKQQVHRKKTN